MLCMVYHHMLSVYIPLTGKTESKLLIHGDGSAVFPDDTQIYPAASVLLLKEVQKTGECGASVPPSLEGLVNQ